MYFHFLVSNAEDQCMHTTPDFYLFKLDSLYFIANIFVRIDGALKKAFLNWRLSNSKHCGSGMMQKCKDVLRIIFLSRFVVGGSV